MLTLGQAVYDLIYPVGSIYMSVLNTSPATLFGGTWVQLKDRFLLGAGDTYTNGNTGGSATQTLSVANLPAHTHGTYYKNLGASGSVASIVGNSGNNDGNVATTSIGSGTAHNNMPPYLVVYMWKRAA